MNEKYILTDNVKRVDGKFVRQIKAVRNFGNIRKGQLGGFISDESNLSHEGRCWVYKDGIVAEHARVIENAQVYKGIVFNSAVICGFAQIGSNCDSNELPQVYGNASVKGNAKIRDYATVGGFAIIKDDATVSDFARVDNDVVMEDNSHAFGYACLFDNAHLRDNAFVCGHCRVGGNVRLVDYCGITDDRTFVGDQELASCEHKKYKLLKNDTMVINGHTLYRIVAVEDGPFCHYGELGGYIESEKNLSQNGNAWIKYPCYAYGDTVIDRNTVLSDRDT